ncbi:MFS transporter [Lactiplantibacillus paraplantarum]|uniref:MFS transporter n=1 Tax=Lactiplantibacillus paraplantarum TaxID=60520 RepID=A0AAD0TXI0_9LACO|nr:MFS transporter [Lactiplantibacillus paraplantarum]AVW11067.1 MFS transporter [Lactiplantibacillus paraplantarum]AYJ39475.1 MFS transporter [Lactiplantibacillus paraplantarum]ERL44762.1 transport protein [Lactiplantibacillus paraplantarum]KRL48509.1 transport protein [Lactiplantibacillus paraplantarum DSM 10667]MCU4684534.1 MFS transporter [Lactiplantibacillus paraplantarum]
MAIKQSDLTINISNHQSSLQIFKAAASNFISSLSGKMFSFGLGLMLLDETHSAISFGINMIISPIVGLLCLVPIGNLIDTYPHKAILTGSLTVRTLALILFATSINLFTATAKLIPIVLFLIIDAISTNINDTCYSAATHELVNGPHIQRLNSLTQSAISLSSILSPALGVGLYSLVGFYGFIILEIIATLASFSIMLTMRFHYPSTNQLTDSRRMPATSHSQFATFRFGLNYMQSRTMIKITILLSVILNFLYTAVTIGIPYILKDQLHTGNGPVGLLETGSAIGMLLGSLLLTLLPSTGQKHLFSKLIIPVLVLDSQIFLLGVLFMTAQSPAGYALLGSLIMGILAFALVILNITFQVYLQQTVPTKLLGRVVATLTTVNSSIMPIGTLLFTLIFQSTTRGGLILIINGILLLGYTALLWQPLHRAIRSEQSNQS